MKIKLNHYHLFIDRPEDAARYEQIKAACSAFGHNLCRVIPLDKRDSAEMPENQTIDPAHLFDNQYNTIEGFRIFDWYEICAFNRGKDNLNYRHGYYLSGDIGALKEAKRNQYICGYCGKRYQAPIEQITCSACLGSEYLTEEYLPLLVLHPVDESHKSALLTEEQLEKLKADRTEALRLANIQRKKLRLERMKRDAKKLIESTTEAFVKNLYEAKIKAALMSAGFDISNLIYYSHADKWSYGWRDPLDNHESASIILKELRTLEASIPESQKFFSTLEFEYA